MVTDGGLQDHFGALKTESKYKMSTDEKSSKILEASMHICSLLLIINMNVFLMRKLACGWLCELGS